MGQNTIGRRRAGGGWQVPSCPLLMLWICSLSELESVLMYGSETMLWKQKEISRVRTVQMDNLKGLMGIRRMNRSRMHR